MKLVQVCVCVCVFNILFCRLLQLYFVQAARMLMSSRDAAVSSLVLARLALLAELWSLALLIQFCKNFSNAVQMSFYNCANNAAYCYCNLKTLYMCLPS